MNHKLEIINSINRLPSELIDIIMNYYWIDIYKKSISSIDNTNYDLIKIINFVYKFIIADPSRVYSNFHLHYYYKKYNNKLNEIIKDKGKLLCLKINSNLKIDFNNLNTIDAYSGIDPSVRTLAILSISMSNVQRYVLYHSFKKFY